MTTYIVHGFVIGDTKKAFTAAIKAGLNVRLTNPDLTGPRYVTMRDIQDRIGWTGTVTNARRSWFASLEVKPGRKIKVV